MRLAAADITHAAVVGRRVTEFSHEGEDPASRPGFDRLNGKGAGLDLGDGIIIGVRTEDDDNHVALLLGQHLTVPARDPDTNRRVKDDHGVELRAPTIPPTATVELGFSLDGWVELADEGDD